MTGEPEPTRQTEPDLSELLRKLVAREPIFHRHEFGTTREDFDRMTDEGFWETGASARYSREYVWAVLENRYATADPDPWQADDFYLQKLAEQIYLLTYTLHQNDRVTRRTTVWRRVETDWRIVYHQGTVVA